jgi:hypothetical protein
MSTASDTADTLYALPPQEFTAARDEQVAAARNAGDRTLAAELSALKRPSVAAWLVNLIALRRPDTVESLVSLGQTIRDAQGTVTAAQLRELSGQRRTELDAAISTVRALATDAGGTSPTAAQLAEAEGTLAAAMADPAAAELVRAARLLKPLTYSGFGAAVGTATESPPAPATAPRVLATAEGAKQAGAKQAAAKQAGAERADAERAEAARLAAAEGRLEEARQGHAAAVATEAALAQQASEIAAQITDLAARLDEIQRESRSARQARLVAERELASAHRRLDRLR